MDDLDRQVIAFVAAQCETEGVSLTSRLAQDLGVDGDQAVEFFQAYAARFGTDLTALHRDWRRHFGPEGWPAGMAVGLVAALVAGLGLALGAVYLGVHPGWVWAAAAAAAGGLLLARRRWGPKGDPITVGDLAAAARRSRWTGTSARGGG